ncbi:MAG: hypothetical protein GY931_04495 [Maribacter sp.]|nr:hypothetical protein [Maribacter sp.]
MNKSAKKSVGSELTEFVHELFLKKEFGEWRDSILRYENGRWYSLIVELDKHSAPLNLINHLGEDIYSKFVFQCIKSPDYKVSNEIKVLFTVTGWIWTSVVGYSKVRDI